MVSWGKKIKIRSKGNKKRGKRKKEKNTLKKGNKALKMHLFGL